MKAGMGRRAGVEGQMKGMRMGKISKEVWIDVKAVGATDTGGDRGGSGEKLQDGDRLWDELHLRFHVATCHMWPAQPCSHREPPQPFVLVWFVWFIEAAQLGSMPQPEPPPRNKIKGASRSKIKMSRNATCRFRPRKSKVAFVIITLS